MDTKSLKHMLSLIDLTSLNDNDTESDIASLCEKAVTDYGSVAAICVYPKFVKFAAKKLFNTTVKIATVANFPEGKDSLMHIKESITTSINEGAQEIDLVLPYSLYLSGQKEEALECVQKSKALCGKNILLKVILETGAFNHATDIAEVSKAVLMSGADFLKTSTGKIPIGATPEAATQMLQAIKEQPLQQAGFTGLLEKRQPIQHLLWCSGCQPIQERDKLSGCKLPENL